MESYIQNNVWKGKDEQGNVVWFCMDLREGDTFHCETYWEARQTFVSNWDNLNEDQKNLA